MKGNHLFAAATLVAASTLGLIVLACAATPANAESGLKNLIPIQNPVPGKVTRRPMRPSSVGFEQNTLGVRIAATRTAVGNQVQTEFSLDPVAALPGQLYDPQSLQRAVLNLNGLAVELNPSNSWLVVYPADLIQRSNVVTAEFYAHNGSLLSSIGNTLGI